MSLSGKSNLLPPERSPAEMLAWSETRLPLAPAGRPAFALWRPKGLAVAIGVSQSSERDIVPEAIRAEGVVLVRRPSGGGAVVLCDGVLCWEAWADLEDVKRFAFDADSGAGSDGGGGGIRAAYAALSAPAIHGLRALGVEAFQAGICDIAVAVNGAGGAPRKLAGTAQLRRRGKALVHGSLLVCADLALLSRYLPQPAQAPEYRGGRGHGAFCVNAAGLLSGVSDCMSVVAGAIADAAVSLGWDILTPPEELPPDAEKLAGEKYLSEDWNWRKIRPLHREHGAIR